MIRCKLFGFPIHIHYFFWILCLILGFSHLELKTPFGWICFAILTAIVTLTVLWHELGHAFYRKKYGAPYSEITLFGMGGVCQGPGEFTPRQRVIIAAAGPLFNMMLLAIFSGSKLLIASGIINPSAVAAPYLEKVIHYGILANAGWAILMLLPILPLDGGRIFAALISTKHQKLVPILGAFLSILIIIVAAITGRYFTALIFVFITYENWRMLRGRNHLAT
jgi:stage IV sporulation protein FB